MRKDIPINVDLIADSDAGGRKIFADYQRKKSIFIITSVTYDISESPFQFWASPA